MEKKTLQKGRSYYRKGKVLWVLKHGEKLFSKVLGSYPYYIEIDLAKNSNKCTCPQGKNCKHVTATIIAFEDGFYLESTDPLSEFLPELLVEKYFFTENPELGLETLLKELHYQIDNDESGSEVARLLRKILKLFPLSPSKEIGFQLKSIFDEFQRVFPEYSLTEDLKKEINDALKDCSL